MQLWNVRRELSAVIANEPSANKKLGYKGWLTIVGPGGELAGYK